MRKPFYVVPVIATILVGCESGVKVGRDQYQSKEDCIQEWSEQQCEVYVDQYVDDEDGKTYGDTYVFGPEFPPSWIGPDGTSYGGRSSIRGFHGNPLLLKSVSTLSSRGIGSVHAGRMVSTIRGGFGGHAMGHAGS